MAGKIILNREMLQILGFRAPGKANLPRTLGRHCPDLVPTFRAGCFLKSTVPAFSSFSDPCTGTARGRPALARQWQNCSQRQFPSIEMSEAWGPPQFQEKHSRSEKAILGAVREFRVFSEQLSEYEIPFSEWHPTT